MLDCCREFVYSQTRGKRRGSILDMAKIKEEMKKEGSSGTISIFACSQNARATDNMGGSHGRDTSLSLSLSLSLSEKTKHTHTHTHTHTHACMHTQHICCCCHHAPDSPQHGKLFCAFPPRPCGVCPRSRGLRGALPNKPGSGHVGRSTPASMPRFGSSVNVNASIRKLRVHDQR